MSPIPPTTSPIAGVPPTSLVMGQWGQWTRADINMNSRGPLGPQDVVTSNPILAVGFSTFQLEVTLTGDHDVTIEVVLCDPFTAAPLGTGSSIGIGEPINGITELFVTTFGNNQGAPMIVTGPFHTFLLRFTVVDTLTTTKITADLRGMG